MGEEKIINKSNLCSGSWGKTGSFFKWMCTLDKNHKGNHKAYGRRNYWVFFSQGYLIVEWTKRGKLIKIDEAWS